MNNILTFRYPTVLTVAGSDSSGGAGIQADLKTLSALGVYGASVITAITAQNTLGVRGIQPVSPEIIRAQMEAVFDDITIDAVKTGMLHSKEAVNILAEIIDRYSPRYIITDPVMISTSGSILMEQHAITAVIEKLFPRATLVTPNISEAEHLSGITIGSVTDMEKAAMKLLSMGCKAVLMKGGHLKSDKMTDILFDSENEPLFLSNPTVSSRNTHGTGCTLSSAIAAYLALGNGIRDAVSLAKNYISNALNAGVDVQTGHGHGPMNHFFAPVPLHKTDRTCN